MRSLVVDSHSSDRTRELAAALGARVIERDWPGYRSQKQFAVDAAAHDWVLCLDADERVSAAAARGDRGAACRGISPAPRAGRCRASPSTSAASCATAMPTRTAWCACSTAAAAAGAGTRSTKTPQVTGACGRLAGHLEHFSYRSLTRPPNRACSATPTSWRRRSTSAAGAAGSRPVLVNPQWRFLRGYLLRLGFLDGWRGLVFALDRGQLRAPQVPGTIHPQPRAAGLTTPPPG